MCLRLASVDDCDVALCPAVAYAFITMLLCIHNAYRSVCLTLDLPQNSKSQVLVAPDKVIRLFFRPHDDSGAIILRHLEHL
jgi:hypothetical protein